MTNFYLRGIDQMRRGTPESRLECQLWLYIMPAFVYLLGIVIHIDSKPRNLVDVIINYLSIIAIYAVYTLWIRRSLVNLWNTKVRRR